MIELCGRRYALPRRKIAVFCVDGCAPEYLDLALEDGLMPRLAEVVRGGGLFVRGRGQIPSFTNPNNLSIVTGAPSAVHGICGNYFFDASTGEEVQMTDPGLLRAPTIFEELERAGVRTLCVTAKDKLRRLLGATRDGGPAPVALSAEKASEQSVPAAGVTSIPELLGKPSPSIYDWSASHYAMEMALALHARLDARVVYVSLTDYVQHKEAPRGPMSNRFYARFDELFGRFLDEGFLCALTADHGMNDKVRADGSPNVRYLEDALAAAGVREARVILPITDPYVVHHGALGSYATVYVGHHEIEAARLALEALDGIEHVLPRAGACELFDLPADRIGDLVVLSDRRTVLGKSAGSHDLSAVRSGLRSHGGLHERTVPIIVSEPLRRAEEDVLFHGLRDATGEPLAMPARPLTNADIFDLVLNRV